MLFRSIRFQIINFQNIFRSNFQILLSVWVLLNLVHHGRFRVVCLFNIVYSLFLLVHVFRFRGVTHSNIIWFQNLEIYLISYLKWNLIRVVIKDLKFWNFNFSKIYSLPNFEISFESNLISKTLKFYLISYLKSLTGMC